MHQDKKISLVTGAGEGIGAAIAIELAKKICM
jgi:NAD(P)-dependent dehydrogenase (short-subunit alcohol dehydrogenase family)